MSARRAAAGLVAAGLLVFAAPGARATDPQDLDLLLPTTLEDAFAGEPDGAEAQFGARYDRRRGRDELLLQPILQLTPLSGLQLNLNLPYVAGSGSGANQGNVDLGALYNLNRESAWLPAFAVAVDFSAPYGPGDRATELMLTGIATRAIDRDGHRRLHVNAAWARRFAPAEEERTIGYRFAVGYSQRVNPETVVIADVVRTRQEHGERPSNVAELGLRRRLSEGVTVGVGAGAGFGPDSPRFRALFSVEADF